MLDSNQIYMILTNGFAPDLRVYKEAKYLVREGYKVTILCWDRTCEYEDRSSEIIDNIIIKRFHIMSKPGSGFKQLKAYISFILQVKKYLAYKDYTYLHCHDLDGALVGIMNKNIRKKKIIFDMHEFYGDGNLKRIAFIIKFLVNYIQTKAYKIIYLNDQQKNNVRKKNLNKLVFIPNYPEMEKFKKVKHIDSDILRITYAGFVRDVKSFEMLIDATGNMKNIFVSIHGAGIASDRVKEMSKSYKNINVTGAFEHQDIIKFYNETDLIYVVYDSNNINCNTAFPTKFYEALSIGCPLIVEEDSLIGKFVQKYDIGFWVNGSDSNSLKRVLDNINKDKGCLKIKSENMRLIAKQYMWEEIVKNLDEIYYNN